LDDDASGVVEVGHCKMSNSRKSRISIRLFEELPVELRTETRTDDDCSVEDCQKRGTEQVSLTGCLVATILAGYFKR